LDWLPARLLLPVFFVSLWLGIVALLSWFGGWAALARSYRLTGEFDGRRWRFRSAMVRHATPMRYARYRSSVTLGANARGLYLAVLPLFRIGHPALFIPWSDVQVSRFDTAFFSYLDFRFRRVEAVYLRLSRSLAQEVAAVGGLTVPE
jgi:hypothetical protein